MNFKKRLFKCWIISACTIPALGIITVACAKPKQHTHVKGNIEQFLLDNHDIERPGLFRCSECGNTYIDTIEPNDIKIPIVNLIGFLEDVTKQDTKKIEVSINTPSNYPDEINLNCGAEIKLQGDHSLRYDKKNFTIKLFDSSSGEKIKLAFKNWPKLNKFVLKANYIDFSEARNIVSALLFGDVIHFRHKQDKIDNLFNGGAIDGFPIALYNNNIFHGFYTFNFPKDKRLYDMSDEKSKKEAMFFSEDYSPQTQMIKEIENWTEDYKDGWDVEHCSTEDTQWIKDSFNNLIRFVLNSDDLTFQQNIQNYIDLDRTIDYMCFIQFCCLDDNRQKNIIWTTYDGARWTPGAYDLDASFGWQYDGVNIWPIDHWVDWSGVPLFKRISDMFFDKIKQQYKELRSGPLSFENVIAKFTDFFSHTNSLLYDADASKWPKRPHIDNNGFEQIKQFVNDHGLWLDQHWQ